jgi:hypothetical protein
MPSTEQILIPVGMCQTRKLWQTNRVCLNQNISFTHVYGVAAANAVFGTYICGIVKCRNRHAEAACTVFTVNSYFKIDEMHETSMRHCCFDPSDIIVCNS